MAALERITSPTDTNILSLVELKTFLRIDNSDEDSLLAALWIAARVMCENYTNVYCNDAADNFKLHMDEWPADSMITIPSAPFTAVSAVKYYDSDDVLTTLSTTDYSGDFKSKQGRIKLDETPTLKDKLNAVEVTMTCGYDEAAIPKPMLHAMQMIAANLYERRGDGMPPNKIISGFEFPAAVKALLDTVKVGGYG